MLRRDFYYRMSLALATLAWMLATTPGLQMVARAAEGPPHVVMVVDGSGSMWGRINEISKFEIARDTMTKVVPNYSDQLAIGLIAYGHRRKSDCQDIQTFVRPALGQSTLLKKSFARISPRGKTPIAASLEHASGLFDQRAGHIVVLTDGIENCRQDLCETATTLRKANPRLTVNVIALGVPQKDLVKIQCVAKNSNGKFFAAYSQAELEHRLTSLFAEITTIEEKKVVTRVPSPKPENAPVPPLLKLYAVATANGQALELPVSWRVVDTSDQKTVFEGKDASPRVSLDKGTFKIEARLGHVSSTKEIVIRDGGEQSVSVTLGGAQLVIPSAASLGSGETITITDKGDTNSVQAVVLTEPNDMPHTLFFPPGQYSVRYDGDMGTEVQPVVLSAGETQRVMLMPALGELMLSATLAADSIKVSNAVFKVYDAKGLEVARSASPLAKLKLAAGSYRVTATAGFAQAEQTINVEPGKTTRLSIPLKAGHLHLSTETTTDKQLTGPTHYSITSIDPALAADPPPEITTNRSGANLTIPAGYYRVTATSGETNLTASSDVIVNAGTEERVRLVFTPSYLKLSTADGNQKRQLIAWEINEDSSVKSPPLVWSGHGQDQSVALAPGAYRVLVRQGMQQKQQKVELAPGQTQSLSITFP